MTKKIIGIAGNVLVQAAEVFHGNQVTYTPQGFVSAIQEVDGLPVVLPVGSPQDSKQYIDQLDALLLAGGQDVSPQLYQEEPHLKLEETNSHRDHFECALIHEAIKQKKPILAVCRGMQLLNVALGGTLYQDLSLFPSWTLKHQQAPTAPQFTTHSIEIAKKTHLEKIAGPSLQVNSYHHQIINQLSSNLQAVSWSKDQVIEAVEGIDKTNAILGVQWHPELDYTVNPISKKIFHYFVHEM